MSVILLVIGILVSGIGVVVVGFGIPINDLALGQTLIIAGATALVGGLVLVGLAAAVTQLTEIAEVLKGRPANRPLRPALSAFIPHEASSEPRPAEALQGEQRPAGLRSPEPRSELRPAETTPELAAPSAIERLRSKLGRPATSEAVPLSPNGGQAGAAPLREAKPTEDAPELRSSEPAARSEIAADKPKEQRFDFLFRSRSARAAQQEAFDAMWPRRVSREAADQAPRPTAGEAPAQTEDGNPARNAATAKAGEGERSVAILKSGVVDGMAYTLYADGSIEAQLPQGTVRFSSIAELRTHIENNS